MRAPLLYHPIPTSNHNLVFLTGAKVQVVYHPIPTSNHNWMFDYVGDELLYIILFLHQTTTTGAFSASFAKLYIILFLHQTTTLVAEPERTAELYIILFLHQTTTHGARMRTLSSCISSYSYIKPQLEEWFIHHYSVVYHPIPTSNHNCAVLLVPCS